MKWTGQTAPKKPAVNPPVHSSNPQRSPHRSTTRTPSSRPTGPLLEPQRSTHRSTTRTPSGQPTGQLCRRNSRTGYLQCWSHLRVNPQVARERRPRRGTGQGAARVDPPLPPPPVAAGGRLSRPATRCRRAPDATRGDCDRSRRLGRRGDAREAGAGCGSAQPVHLPVGLGGQYHPRLQVDARGHGGGEAVLCKGAERNVSERCRA